MLPYKTSHTGLSVDSLPPLTQPFGGDPMSKPPLANNFSSMEPYHPCEFHITFGILGFS